jgi:flagellar hook-associated protein 2
MAISFGGLATGLDTTSLIEQLMEAERQPLTRLEKDKSYFNARLAALGKFEDKLESFLDKIENLDAPEKLQAKTASLSSKDFFSVTVDSEASRGNYQVEVVDLAQVQKSVGLGVVDKTASSFGLGTLTLTVGDNDPVDITIDAENNSLEGIMAAINEADAGVTASIINDGTANPYRLVLTGEDIATNFSFTSAMPSFNGNVTSLVAGGYADQDAQLFGTGTISLSTGHDITLGGTNNSLADIRDAINAETGTTGVSGTIEDDGNGGWKLELVGGTIDSTNLSGGTGYAAPSLSISQSAQQAHIRVDGIDIYSDSNSLTEAIPGVSVDLTKAEEGTITKLTVDQDENAIKGLIKSFVSGYNDVVSFVTGQSTAEGSGAGILVGDSGLNNIKRRLQNMLTTQVDSSVSSLSQLGLKTQKNGTLEIDDEILTEAIQNNLDGVTTLLVGDDSTEGIATRLKSYLEDTTDNIDGFYAGRKQSIESNVKRMDRSIELMELRLEKREQNLYDQYNALEQLISSMNSTSSYLSTQLASLENLWSYNK